MEVKPGYKHTEIGVIPEDWEVKKLRDCLLESPSYGVNAPATVYSENLPTYLRITDITDDGHFSKEKKASVSFDGIEKFYLSNGDLVFARTGASVGKTYLYKPKDGVLAFAGFLIRVRTDPVVLLPEYLANYVQTPQYWNWVQVMSMRSGQPGINSTEYGQLLVPVPNDIFEQRAIAAALSDVDALLAALDALIAKKRLIKQGAMQELLTEKRRLPGFSEEWEIGKLEDYFSYISYGFTNPMPTVANGIYMITAANIFYGSIQFEAARFTSVDAYNNLLTSKSKPLKNDILLTKDGTLGRVALVDDTQLCINQSVAIIRPNDKVYPPFLKLLLEAPIYQKMMIDDAGGSTIKHIYITKINLMPVAIPSTKDEQRAIAEILSDMDAEIQALEQRRAKTRLLKQGMMQELLTGRVRLV